MARKVPWGGSRSEGMGFLSLPFNSGGWCRLESHSDQFPFTHRWRVPTGYPQVKGDSWTGNQASRMQRTRRLRKEAFSLPSRPAHASLLKPCIPSNGKGIGGLEVLEQWGRENTPLLHPQVSAVWDSSSHGSSLPTDPDKPGSQAAAASYVKGERQKCHILSCGWGFTSPSIHKDEWDFAKSWAMSQNLASGPQSEPKCTTTTPRSNFDIRSFGDPCTSLVTTMSHEVFSLPFLILFIYDSYTPPFQYNVCPKLAYSE